MITTHTLKKQHARWRFLVLAFLGWVGRQEEEEEDAGAVAPGVAPKMSAAKAAKSAAEKDARIAVSCGEDVIP